MKDIVCFLKIVDYVKPKVWAMENVPRVAQIIEAELRPGGRLRRFHHLGIKARVVNMEEFGLPQRRLRCIAGNFDFDLLHAFSANATKRTLGEIVEALANDSVIDPIYKIQLSKASLTDHVIEDCLNDEETRINRANKTAHPVYNQMPFPDSLNRSVRTITATCTRVSRESIVIPDSVTPDAVRRLTVRERACLQGFPITYQFCGRTHAQKLKLVGNALPPLFSFYVGHTIKRTSVRRIPSIAARAKLLLKKPVEAPSARPEKPGSKYPSSRTFRFAVPSLRLKSGVRFELVNAHSVRGTNWLINFYFGSSKSIHDLRLGQGFERDVIKNLPSSVGKDVKAVCLRVSKFLATADLQNMQKVWSHKARGKTHPFELLDCVDAAGAELSEILTSHAGICSMLVNKAILERYGRRVRKVVGIGKLERNSSRIVAGLTIGSIVNEFIGNQYYKPRATSELNEQVIAVSFTT
ncbi:putative DNA methylase [Afipia carboxidovorans OM5]|uniref:DNA (cytosine-5-)-methyltransferase n=1 Tax=Afipia carboxidovorans (strain ATCC 49405 / DSM 1227 / KCTC 32145 / OM5) TaxID=504832 RepID=F8BUN9_AFIC5|nr:putative DNA methylase [Afipia carboxidovorans OM4]AEI05092.1 putative DNA methylase [Afipia carboxidovorans OM5]